MAGKVIGKGPLRGYLLEEVLAWLLRSSGFEVLTADDDKDKEPWKVLKEDKNGLLVRGRGAWHQVDALGQFRYVPPFSLPVRLFVEAKYLTTAPVGLPTVRNGHGVIHDVNEGETTTLTAPGTGRPRTRYRYSYAIFSTSGFSPEAQDYALAHQISLIDLSAPDFAVLRNLVKNTADTIHAVLEATPAAERPKVRGIRAYLRGPLLEMDPGDVDLPDEIRSSLDYLAQVPCTAGRSSVSFWPFLQRRSFSDWPRMICTPSSITRERIPRTRCACAASISQRHTPFGNCAPRSTPRHTRCGSDSRQRVESWIVAQDEGMPARTRYIRRSMLSTMTLYWMHGEHAQTFQLRLDG